MKVIDFNNWKRKKRKAKYSFNITKPLLFQAAIVIVTGYLLSFLRIPSWCSVLLALTIVTYLPYSYYRFYRRYR